MTYQVRRYGDPALRRKAVPVETVDDAVRQLAQDMLQAMYRENGIGLAAEQVGRREALCVIHVPPSEEGEEPAPASGGDAVPMPWVLVNPEITAMRGEQTGQEGCLSFPEIFIPIRRAEEITVSYTGLDSRRQTARVSGLLARAVQHEVDHLNAVLLVDRMSAVQKVAVAGKLKRLKRSARG